MKSLLGATGAALCIAVLMHAGFSHLAYDAVQKQGRNYAKANGYDPAGVKCSFHHENWYCSILDGEGSFDVICDYFEGCEKQRLERSE